MLSTAFDRLFARLVAAFTAYQSAPRDPERVVELGAAHWDLYLVRGAIARERDRMGPERPQLSTPQIAVSEDDLARLRVGVFGGVQG